MAVMGNSSNRRMTGNWSRAFPVFKKSPVSNNGAIQDNVIIVFWHKHRDSMWITLQNYSKNLKSEQLCDSMFSPCRSRGSRYCLINNDFQLACHWGPCGAGDILLPFAFWLKNLQTSRRSACIFPPKANIPSIHHTPCRCQASENRWWYTNKKSRNDEIWKIHGSKNKQSP